MVRRSTDRCITTHLTMGFESTIIAGCCPQEAEMKQQAEAAPIERLLKVNEVAEILQMSSSWVYKQVEAGLLPHVRLGANVRFRPEDVRAYARGEWVPRNTAVSLLAAGKAK